VALFVAGLYRIFLICFGVHFWYLGHCVGYAVVASVLLGAAVVRHFAVVNPSAARRAALEHTVVRLRECSRRKGPGSSSSVSEGRTSSTVRSSSVAAEQIGAALEIMGRANARHQGEACNAPPSHHAVAGTAEEFVSGVGLQNIGERDKPASCRPTNFPDQDASDGHRLAFLGSGQAPSAVQNLEVNNPFGSSTDQQAFDLNLALMFQERMNDPLFTSMLRHRSPEFLSRGGEQELTTLLQDKGLDPNFAVMLKEKGLDPTILALLQRSSLDAGRDCTENNGEATTGGNQSQIVVPEEPISLSEELRRHQWDKWVQQMRWFVQLFAGTPERAWILFSIIFVVESIFVAVFRPSTVTVINATHEQFEFGVSALLFSPVMGSILAFLRSLQADEMVFTKRVCKVQLSLLLLQQGWFFTYTLCNLLICSLDLSAGTSD
jgi:hypothetical protein